MAINLQDEDFNDGIEEVFQQSTVDWLSQDDLPAIYNRHALIPFPISHIRRRNCISGRPVAGDEISHTEATMLTPNGDLFSRRNHHRSENLLCMVHYQYNLASSFTNI
ncbi:hypothetical protein YC2023_119805 [Brassica napus]